HRRLAGVRARVVFEVALVVVVAHQRLPVPADLVDGPACAFESASHCFCTSFSAEVITMPDGAKMRDGIGLSSASGRPVPRIALTAMTTPAVNTMSTSTAKTIDSVPWMKVLRMTASSAPASLAAPKLVCPASLALRYWKCCVQ